MTPIDKGAVTTESGDEEECEDEEEEEAGPTEASLPKRVSETGTRVTPNRISSATELSHNFVSYCFVPKNRRLVLESNRLYLTRGTIR